MESLAHVAVVAGLLGAFGYFVLFDKTQMGARWFVFIDVLIFLFATITYLLGAFIAGIGSAVSDIMRRRRKQGSLLAHEEKLERELLHNIQRLNQLKALPLKTAESIEESRKLMENLKVVTRMQATALYLVKIDKLFLELAEIGYRPIHSSAEEYQKQVMLIQNVKGGVYDELRRIQRLCSELSIQFEPDVEHRMYDLEALCDRKIEELTLEEAHRISGDIRLLENQELASTVISARQYQDQDFWLRGQANIVQKWKQTEAHYNTLGEARVIHDTQSGNQAQ